MPCPPQLSIDAFPAWARLNGLALGGIGLRHVDGKGCGFVFAAAGEDAQPLLTVPSDVVLSSEAVHEYAKIDSGFKQLLDAVGPQSARVTAMLYLLCHLAHARRGHSSKSLTSTPWTEYVRFLPSSIPTPTMWSEPERLLLEGTSLEAALGAKLSALAAEFDGICAAAEAVPLWTALMGEHDTVGLDDWVLVDAWYRSRCLELPHAGEAMVPGLDMANHSASPSAYYEVDGNSDVVLLARPDGGAACGREVDISYGHEKSAAEMLFSYGFVDGASTARSLTLPVDPFSDDPLAQAKVHVFGGRRAVTLTQGDGGVECKCPFAYLVCLNEEDGLDFRLLQDAQGQRQLRMLWQGDDVTERAGDVETLVQTHDLYQVFRLRVVAVLHERVETQLARIRDGPSDDELQPLVASGLLRDECVVAAKALRAAETGILEAAAQALESEKSTLLAHDHVVAYLESQKELGRDDTGPGGTEAPNEDDDDFS